MKALIACEYSGTVRDAFITLGHDVSKQTALWLKGLLNLTPTQIVAPRMVDGKPRWANQTDSGQNRLSPSPDRWKLRSTTYQGIADAMAQQWSQGLG